MMFFTKPEAMLEVCTPEERDKLRELFEAVNAWHFTINPDLIIVFAASFLCGNFFSTWKGNNQSSSGLIALYSGLFINISCHGRYSCADIHALAGSSGVANPPG